MNNITFKPASRFRSWSITFVSLVWAAAVFTPDRFWDSNPFEILGVLIFLIVNDIRGRIR